MKKLSVSALFLVFVSSLFMITCDLLKVNSEDSKKFWARDFSRSRFYQVSAQLLAENSRCEVWVENGCGVSETKAKNIANEYASNIYVKMMKTFGYTIDDPDMGEVNTMEIAHYLATGKTKGAKLTILLLDIKDGYKTQRDPYVGGYFYPVDLFENDPKSIMFKYSNEREMIYLDTYPSTTASQSSYETLAHEMQHLMNFISSVVYRFDGETLSLMDTWVDEGLSAAAQWVYSGQHPEERWKYYIEDRSGLIKKGNNFFMWDNHDAESPLANLDDYATVYLFFQYLRLQSGKPDDIYHDIHTSEFPDYQAVITAESINSSHKDNWPLLLRDWHAANYTNNTSGLYGYKDESKLKDIKAPMVPAGTASLDLFPGEGVYSKTITAESVPAVSGNIKYAGLSSTGLAPSDTFGYENGARLTYNVDTDTEGLSEKGSTTGIAPNAGISITGGSGSLQIDLNKFSGPFKVDAGYFNRRNGNPSMFDNKITNILNKDNIRSVNKDNYIHKFDKSKIKRVFIDE